MTGPVTRTVSEQTDPRADQPPLLLIKGDATDEEVAALVAVVQGLATAAAQTAPPAPGERSTWAAPARAMRLPLHPSPQGWRTSGRPS